MKWVRKLTEIIGEEVLKAVIHAAQGYIIEEINVDRAAIQVRLCATEVCQEELAKELTTNST